MCVGFQLSLRDWAYFVHTQIGFDSQIDPNLTLIKILPINHNQDKPMKFSHLT